MKTAINTRTQEEYDALMRYYESKGIKWESGDEATENDYWEKCYKKSTCIVENHEGDGLSFANISYWTQEGYSIIPYTEFAKANITESPNYEERYREAVKLLEWTKQVCSNIQRTKTYGTKFPETGTLGNAIDDFLTNHKDGD